MDKTIKFKTGDEVLKLGMGTWYIGDKRKTHDSEIEALRSGIELGMTLIDTAEMYGSGRSEKLIGEAIKPINRSKIFVVSKVYPQNAGKKNLEKSLEASLKRLQTDYLDMYLLHWRGNIPLSETIYCMEEQVKKGKIRSWGVSNFDVEDMEELLSIENGKNCEVNQVLYNLSSRGTEYALMPLLKENNIKLMAYCPLARGYNKNLYGSECITKICKEHNVTPSQVLLNFILQKENIFAIPKSSTLKHAEENYKALNFDLTADDMELLDRYFPAPQYKTELDML